jgi:hypothetical protein
LTHKQAQELALLIQNGYGSGDFYGLNNSHPPATPKQRYAARCARAGYANLAAALNFKNCAL